VQQDSWPFGISELALQLLSARKLRELDPDKPSMAKQFFVDKAIDDAAFILERIDKR
jgi:hypothetical protein